MRLSVLRLVLDSTPLIAFFREMDGKHIPGLLASNGFKCIIPEGVRCEIVKEPTRSALVKAINTGEITVEVLDDLAAVAGLQTRYSSLGRGESEVIVIAQRHSMRGEAVMCIIDETPARKVADRLGLEKMGTIGLLRMMAKEGIISGSMMNELIRQLEDSSFRISRKLCDSKG